MSMYVNGKCELKSLYFSFFINFSSCLILISHRRLTRINNFYFEIVICEFENDFAFQHIFNTWNCLRLAGVPVFERQTFIVSQMSQALYYEIHASVFLPSRRRLLLHEIGVDSVIPPWKLYLKQH